MENHESTAARKQREEHECFNESHWKVAKALSLQWDDLLDDLLGIAENIGLDNDRAIGIGEMDWAIRLDRFEDGHDCLTDGDFELLKEVGKFFDKGKLVFRDGIATTLSASQIATMEDWQAATYRERAISFGMYSWSRVSCGEVGEDGAVFLFGLVNRLMGYFENHDDSGETAAAKSHIFSKLGEKGAANKHRPMGILREFAVEKYKAGNWKSANQAAHALKDCVIEHGRPIKAYLTEANAQRTIAEWFRKSA